MSASSNKKLRTEQDTSKLTERQIAEQQEAKKVKMYTIAFVVVLVFLLAIAAYVGISQYIRTSGVNENKTIALTVGDTQLNNTELNYFFMDSVNNFYSQNGNYAAIFGLDVTKPLNQQVMDPETGETWADYFVNTAKTNATSVYALYGAAVKEGFTMPEAQQNSVDSTISTLELYSTIYGYKDANQYLKAIYGSGASLESYRSYLEKTMLASAYQTAYADSLTFTDADLRAAEADNYNKYSSYAYNYYNLPVSKFLEGGTTDENGNTTYSDEEKAAAQQKAEAAAKSLTGEEITTAQALDAAIAALSINADNDTAMSTRYDDQSYTGINSTIAQWLSDSSRKEGDITYLANSTTDSDGKETINGYYVVRFDSVNDNTFPLKNVRHILVSFEGGTSDDSGNITYSEEEKAAAKATAEELLNQWKSGEATEDSFAALATEKSSDTGSTANGGLYEDIYPNQMVASFNDWCFAEGRKAGDTGIVETQYGYHVMYFVGDSDVTYRDYQIRNELTENAVSEWYADLIANTNVTAGDTRYLSLGTVLSRNH